MTTQKQTVVAKKGAFHLYGNAPDEQETKPADTRSVLLLALAPEQAAALGTHTEQCPVCNAVLAWFRVKGAA